MANYIEKNDDKLAVSSLTDEDVRTIVALSKDERIAEKVSPFSYVFIGFQAVYNFWPKLSCVPT